MQNEHADEIRYGRFARLGEYIISQDTPGGAVTLNRISIQDRSLGQSIRLSHVDTYGDWETALSEMQRRHNPL